MNYYHFLSAAAPDKGFATISFDGFLKQLSANFLVAMLAVFALFLLSVLMYLAICFLVQLWNYFMEDDPYFSKQELP